MSDDDGLTWHHRRITDQLKLDSHGKDRRIGGLFAAAGNGIQVHTGPYRGRLVQQFVLLVDGIIGAASALSDDHGDTSRLGDIIQPSPGEPRPNENKTVCLSDGRLLLHSRATPRRLAAAHSRSGQSWSPLTAVEDLPDPSDNGSPLSVRLV
ncbi:exo-alpha-sialidase [Micromonospora sp. ATA32]|nr:exo-alpha-sialidase [Micromonospora sp. ATA32]